MSQEIDEMTAGLEENAVNTTDKKTTRRRKEQTPEDVETIKAGVAKLVELGVSDNARVILENVAHVWNSEDKEAIALAKEEIIRHFGGSEALKDYVDNDAKNELMAFAGIAKIMPIWNNFCSFYARRQSVKKAASVQVNIGGVLYNVDKAYYNSLADKSKEEKRELLLAHEGTVKAGDIPEVL